MKYRTLGVTVLADKKIKIIRYLGFALTLITMITIFMFSSGNAQVSSSQSGKITKTVIKVTHSDFDTLAKEKQTEIYNDTEHIIRKLAHFSIFALLGFSAMTAAGTYKTGSRKATAVRFAICAAFCLAYAISDEFHQTFVSGRNGNVTDVLIDFSGACIGMLISYLIIYRLITLRRTAGGANR